MYNSFSFVISEKIGLSKKTFRLQRNLKVSPLGAWVQWYALYSLKLYPSTTKRHFAKGGAKTQMPVMLFKWYHIPFPVRSSNELILLGAVMNYWLALDSKYIKKRNTAIFSLIYVLCSVLGLTQFKMFTKIDIWLISSRHKHRNTIRIKENLTKLKLSFI